MRVYGLCVNEGRVLLVRSSNPAFDPPLWWLPGGGIHFGESPLEALTREFDEETGLAVADASLIDVVSDVRTRPNGDLGHAVRIIYAVESRAGELRHETSGTTDRAAWVDLAEVHEANLAEYTRDVVYRFCPK